MSPGVVLYGPPASGKDTITAALAEVGPFELVPRLKAGSGRTAGYRMVTAEHIDRLHTEQGLLWETRRYGSIYALARDSVLGVGGVPVVHVGQVGAVQAVTGRVPERAWTVVELWCPRDVAAGRIAERRTGDDDARLAAYDTTERLTSPDLVIDTSRVAPGAAARLIQQQVAR